jgi:hypothetical protein
LFEVKLLQSREQGGDTGDVWFAADAADVRMSQSLTHQMLARAESDLEPNPRDGAPKQELRIESLTIDRQRKPERR